MDARPTGSWGWKGAALALAAVSLWALVDGGSAVAGRRAPGACGDGVCGSGEGHCTCPDDCGAAPSEELCHDGADNDCNGWIDCHDPVCSADSACACLSRWSPCADDDDCCSGRCRGSARRGKRCR